MAIYSLELKQQIVKKMMPPNRQTVATLSRQTGISAPTLYAWKKKQFQARGFVVPGKPSNADQWDAKAKLAAVIQTVSMNETERSTYCREHGLYVEQLDAWKQAFEAVEEPVSKADLAAAKRQNRKLLRPATIGLLVGHQPVPSASRVNRRMRNRTYGGVGWGRRIPAPYPIRFGIFLSADWLHVF